MSRNNGSHLNDQPTQNGCRQYFLHGGFVGLAGLVVAILGLIISAGSGSATDGGSGGSFNNPEPPAPVPTRQLELVNLSGSWGAEGYPQLTYIITHGGSDFVIEEFTSGISTAYGEGTYREGSAEIEFVAANNSYGIGSIAIGSSSERLTAIFENQTFGTRSTLQLYRR